MRLVLVARLSCVTGIAMLTLTVGQFLGLSAVVLLCATAALATLLQTRTGLSMGWVAAGEAVVTGLLIGGNLPDSAICLPYLLIPPLAAGCAAGVRAVVWVGLLQAVSLYVPAVVTGELADAATRVQQLFPWLLTGIGIGLLGARLRAVGPIRRGEDVPYESARRLISQLRSVTGRLSAGLDSVGMAEQVLADVQATSAMGSSLLLVQSRTGVFVPLARYGPATNDLETPTPESLAVQCAERCSPVQRTLARDGEMSRHFLALPLLVDDRVLGVLLATVAHTQPPDALAVLQRTLNQYSLRLDTALAFDEIRSVATSDERRRVAGEIHDGIAQEAASLGYLVDDLSASAESSTQRTKLQELRRELSRLVAQLRLSIVDLRSDITPTTSLVAALSQHVRRVGAQSSMTVHLSLDETPNRLRTEVETELLRIAQEAIVNARKHSGAANLWVTARVHPPLAELYVEDDGCGLGVGRTDSYGLAIMRERAERVNASFAVTPRVGGGTRVSVELVPQTLRIETTEGDLSRVYERAAS